MEFDKKFIAEFIDEYKNHPALWNVKSDISKNKHLRNKGIEALVKKCQEKIPEADDAFVKKKINNLRTAYRRELAKVRSSKRTGSSTDDIYSPTLWYYDLLSFTLDHETGREGISSNDDSITFSNMSDNDIIVDEYNQSVSSEIEYTQSDAQQISSPSPSLPKFSLPKKQKSFIAKKREFIDIASETMKSLNAPLKEDDECDIIGKRFAMQLRGMKESQMFLAEKIIGDVMYYGRMDKLTENSFQFNSTNVSFTEPTINASSMINSTQNNILPTLNTQKNVQQQTPPPQSSIYNQPRQYMLKNTYPYQLPAQYLQHDDSQHILNSGHNIQQYSFDFGMPFTQHNNRAHLDMSSSSMLANDTTDPDVSV